MNDLEDFIEADNRLSEEEEFTSCVSSGHQALYRLQDWLSFRQSYEENKEK